LTAFAIRAWASANGADEIAAAHAELDRDVALAALAIDERSPGVERDVRELAERNVAVGARLASNRRP